MRGNVLKIIVFVAILVAIDVALMAFGDYLRSNARGGYTLWQTEVNSTSRAPVLVYGSSRASHHYDTPLLTDSLGMEVYNCGVDGNGILLAYMQLANLLEYHHPRMVILDFYDLFDLMDTGNNEAALKWARPYYGKGAAVEVFDDIDPTERYKLISGAYRYNSIWLQMLKDNISSSSIGEKGYLPIDGIMSGAHQPDNRYLTASPDAVKTKYLDRFFALCRENDIKIAVIISPYYFEKDTERTLAPIREIFARYGIEPVSYLSSPLFCGQDSLFSDPGHMNRDGARRFSNDIVPYLRDILGQ